MLKIFETNDFCRHVGMTVMKMLRAGVNTWNLYEPLQLKRRVHYSLRGRHSFANRSHDSDSLLVVLAGYKEALWDEVFGRIARFLPDDIDVCVVTSGKRVVRLESLCAERGWSYLCTRRNHVCLAQNLAIHCHPKARWIYKIDEDIFLTAGFFEKLKEIYRKAECEQRFEIGFVAPLIPVNGYGHVRVLEKTGLVDEWEARFGRLRYTEGFYRNTSILSNPDAARFMWGIGNPKLRDIDALNERFAADVTYSVCPIRFSIGAILFNRFTWADWGMFPVVMGTGMGEDEEHVCRYCLMHSKAMVVAENALVGHLAYGPQTGAMMGEFSNGRIPHVS